MTETGFDDRILDGAESIDLFLKVLSILDYNHSQLPNVAFDDLTTTFVCSGPDSSYRSVHSKPMVATSIPSFPSRRRAMTVPSSA